MTMQRKFGVLWSVQVEKMQSVVMQFSILSNENEWIDTSNVHNREVWLELFNFHNYEKRCFFTLQDHFCITLHLHYSQVSFTCRCYWSFITGLSQSR